MKRFIPLAVFAALLSGCSAMNGSAPTAAQCAALQIAASDPMLVAKCERAPDPLKDASCISISALTTMYGLCLAQIPPPAVPAS